MSRIVILALLAALPGLLGGCCTVARVLCGIEAPESPPRTTRDTPDDAVDHLVDAVRNGRKRDVFESLHPDFVEAAGGFSLSEFSAGYEDMEDVLRRDVEVLAEAPRTHGVAQDGAVRIVTVDDGHAAITFAFVNVPAWEVHLDDEDYPRFIGNLGDLAGRLRVSESSLEVAGPIDLDGRGGFPPELVKRVSLHNDWLIYGIRDVRNLELADVLHNRYGETGQ